MCPLKALGLPCSSYIYLLSDVIFSFVLFVTLGMCVCVFLVYVCVVCVYVGVSGAMGPECRPFYASF